MPIGAGEQLLGKTVEKRLIHSVTTAAAELKVHPKRLRKILAAKGLIDADHEGRHNNHVLMDAAAVQQLYDDGVLTGLTRKDAEEYLGAGRVQTKLLADAGIIVPAIASADISNKNGWCSFTTNHLDDFLRRLQDGAIPVDQPVENQMDIPAAAKRANCSAAEIVKMVLDKKLAWTGRLTSREKYMAILVDVSEIKAKTQLPPLDGLTAAQIQNTLKTTHRVVKALIDNGVLKTERHINPINRCPVMIVPTAEVARFRQTYVSLMELAEERRLHSTTVKRLLDDEGVRPALGPAIFHATFYRRCDID